jgi:hypothetical protein
MLETKSALWRIEFRTDASKVGALTIPLGFLRESWADNAGRFMGLIFRTRLTPLELDRVNLNTWAELSSDRLEPFMDELFDKAWSDSRGAADGQLGAGALAANYGAHSALSFVGTEVKECRAATWQNLRLQLIGAMFSLEDRLSPVLMADVVPIKGRKPEMLDRPFQEYFAAAA